MTSEDGLERVACAVCGASDEEELYEKKGFHIVRCRDCGLAYVNPRLTLDALVRLYNDQKISWTSYYVDREKEDTRSFTPRIELVERYRKPGRLLEMGCGPGVFLKLARSRGWDVRGIDVNAESVKACQDAGLDVVCGPFPHAEFEGQSFDAAVMIDFLEHVLDPRGVLEATRDLLAPGGALLVTTPDVGSLMARVSRRHWTHLKPDEHLYYFNRETIRRLMDEVGFDVVWQKSMGRLRSLGTVIDALRTYNRPLSRFARKLTPSMIAEGLTFPLNPGDEMGVLAIKR